MKIKNIKARQILDSRGNPTVECDVILENGAWGRAAVPSGASTGEGEALELRDGDIAKYGGKGVLKAIANIMNEIKPSLIGFDAAQQSEIDQRMKTLDGTANKSRLGANAILAVSLATAKAEANAQGLPFYQYIAKVSGTDGLSLPMPMMNVMNGGAHADFATDIQEYMIIPVGAQSFADAIRIGSEVFHALGGIVKDLGFLKTVGDEGGYAQKWSGGNETPFKLILQAIEKAGYQPSRDVVIAIDSAASEFYSKGAYNLASDDAKFDADQMIEFYRIASSRYPIVSIEDGFDQNDWPAWSKFTAELGSKIQIVGDDLYATNVEHLRRGITERASNAILVKANQIGTLSETIETVKLAQANGFATVMSHRSGETEDTTIAHLAVGLNCRQIKTGSLSRSERVAKYNELIRIEEQNPSLKLANPLAAQTQIN